MSYEIYLMNRLSSGSGIYAMTKGVNYGWEVYMMRKPDSTLPEEEGGCGSNTPSYNWVPFLSTIQWGSTWGPSSQWTNTPGSFSGAHGIYTAPAGYKYVKIVGISGAVLPDGCWKNSLGQYVGSLCLKTKIDAMIAGSGATYGSSTTAKADWAVASAIVSLDSTRQYTVGYYDPNPSLCSDYIAFQTYVSA